MHDVAEGCGNTAPIEKGIQEADRLADFLAEASNQGSPEGCDGAGSSEDEVVAFDTDLIPGGGIAVTGNIGDAAAASGTAGLRRHGDGRLVVGFREELADAASCGSANLVAR